MGADTIVLVGVALVLACMFWLADVPILSIGAVFAAVAVGIHGDDIESSLREADAQQQAQRVADAKPRPVSRSDDGCVVYAFKPQDRWLYFTLCEGKQTTTTNVHQECTSSGKHRRCTGSSYDRHPTMEEAIERVRPIGYGPKLMPQVSGFDQASVVQQEPVGEVYRYGRDSHGREWHGIHWYDAAVDVPAGTKLYTNLAQQAAPACSGGWEAHAKALEQELAYWKQRAQAMHEHQKGECWYWQGDGNDHPESMVGSLPVVIRADALRGPMVSQPAASQQEAVAWWYDVGGKVHLEKSQLDHYHMANGEYVKGRPLVFGDVGQGQEKAEQANPARSAFEAWIRMDSTLTVARDEHGYADFTTALMWHAWQAAVKATGTESCSCSR